jgi:hypothetical protein
VVDVADVDAEVDDSRMPSRVVLDLETQKTPDLNDPGFAPDARGRVASRRHC